MNSVDVLVIGGLGRNPDGSVVMGRTFSTSALVRTDDGHVIVVDTSQRYVGNALRDAFERVGKCFPKDVDIVVLTHNHADHVGNADMFPNAEVLVHEGEEPFPGATVVTKDSEIARGVRLIHTPGHTAGSMSVFVQADAKIAIVGDAVPLKANFVERKPPALNIDPGIAMASMRKIADFADVIIPGHDPPFVTGVFRAGEENL